MDPIFDILTGFVKMAVLKTAIDLNIAQVLEEIHDLTEIGRALDLKADSGGLGYFLDAMAALGFVRKQDGEYENTAFGRHFLCSQSPVYMGGLVNNMKRMQHRNLTDMANIIRNGPPQVAPDQQLFSEKKWEIALAHLASYQRAGMAEKAADIVQDLPEFSGAKKLLDLGCGPGLMGMEMIRRNPDLSGVLMDLPGIIRLTAKEVEKEGLSSRITLIPGDYNQVDLGKNYDIIWASHNLYYVKNPLSFFKRVKASLTANGVFLSLHEGLVHERTGPPEVVLSRLSLALEGQDVSFEKGELANHLRAAGFGRVETRMLCLPAGKAELVVARKGEKP